jgi:hypothetical protein
MRYTSRDTITKANGKNDLCFDGTKHGYIYGYNHQDKWQE